MYRNNNSELFAELELFVHTENMGFRNYFQSPLITNSSCVPFSYEFLHLFWYAFHGVL